MNKFKILFSIFILTLTIPLASQAKKSKSKIQEVNFDEMNINGTARNPEGAYLVQKKGIKFMPLHDLQKNIDQKIRETAVYLD